LAHLDTSFCVSTTTRTGGDVQDDAAEANCIIVPDSGLIAKAADPIDIKSFGQRPPCRLALPRPLGKPRIEVRFKRAVEKRRSLLSCGNPGKPELLN
jgi:hypothetical protein